MPHNDLLAEIKQFIPEDKFDIFSEQIEVAIELYEDIDDPKRVQKELQELARLSKKVNYTLVNAIKNSSPTTIRFLERFLSLPTYPNVDSFKELTLYANDIRRRITRGSSLTPDASYSFPSGAHRIGRPLSHRVNVLVSFVAAAYVAATGNGIRRKWDADGTLPIHIILAATFHELKIGASVDEAIRRLKLKDAF